MIAARSTRLWHYRVPLVQSDEVLTWAARCLSPSGWNSRKICFVDDDGRGIHHEHVFTIENQIDALLFRLRWPPDWLWHPLWLPCSRTG